MEEIVGVSLHFPIYQVGDEKELNVIDLWIENCCPFSLCITSPPRKGQLSLWLPCQSHISQMCVSFWVLLSTKLFLVCTSILSWKTGTITWLTSKHLSSSSLQLLSLYSTWKGRATKEDGRVVCHESLEVSPRQHQPCRKTDVTEIRASGTIDFSSRCLTGVNKRKTNKILIRMVFLTYPGGEKALCWNLKYI